MFDANLFMGKSHVAVALSGGKDSVFLLYQLLEHAQKLNIEVCAVNVEHGIRGQNSVNDTLFCKNLCEKLGVLIKCYSVNAPEYAKKQRLSLENAARELRYQCFNDAVLSGFCDCVATAHHLSDNAESILFNLLRGSSSSGLTGIAPKNSDGTVIRPILGVSREYIDDYVAKNNLDFVEDESNASEEYTRNYLRKQIIPLIKERFPAFERSAKRFADITRKENDYLNDQAKALIKENTVFYKNGDSEVLFTRACLLVMKAMGFEKDYEKVHLDALLGLAGEQIGKRINLKNGLIAIRTRDGILFEKESPALLDEEIPFVLGEVKFNNYALKFEKSEAIERLTALYFDLDKLPKGAVIRLRKPGDVIRTFGGINKSLKKYFSDKKIESRISTRLPLIAKGKKVYLICGVDISEDLRVDKNSRNIIKFTFTLKEN